MSKSIVSAILNKVLSDYVEGIDANSLDLDIWNGDLNLNNLWLRPSALDATEFPVSVVHGHIGNIHSKIPWTSIGSAPIVAEVSDLSIVVRPNRCVKCDEKLERDRQNVVKRKRLDNDKLVRKLRKTAQEAAEESGESYYTRLTETVVNNLQISISNVHVRYEDASDSRNPIVFGVKVASFEVKSTDENWMETFIKVVNGTLHKIAHLQELSVYVNKKPDVEIISNIEDQEEFIKAMNECDKEDFVLEPVNGVLMVKIRKGAATTFTEPNFSAELVIDQVSISVDDKQHTDVLATLDYFSNHQRIDKYRQSRPNVGFSTAEERKEWWNYAFNAITSDIERGKFSWQNVTERKRKMNEYIALYKRTKSKRLTWLQPLDTYEQELYSKLEEELDYESVALCRQIAKGEIKTEREEYEKEPKQHKSWYSRWWGDTEQQAKHIEYSDEERRELLEKLGYYEEFVSTQYPEDYIKTSLRVHLKTGTVTLMDHKENRSIVEGRIDDLIASLGLRENSSIANSTLRNMTVRDTYYDTPFPEILRRSNDETLISILLENEPTKSYLEVNVGTTEIIVNVPLLQTMIAFMNVKRQIRKHASPWQIRMELEERKELDINVTINTPTFIIPHKSDDTLLLVDLGTLKVRSDIDQDRKNRLKNITERVENDFYDKYKVELTDIQVMRIEREHWHEQGYGTPILERLDIRIGLQQCILPESQYAAYKLDGSVSRIKINFSPELFRHLIAISNDVMELVDNPTGRNSNAARMSGSLVVTRGELISHQEYYCELHDERVLIYSSQLARGRPVVSIDVFGNGAIVFDDSKVYSSRKKKGRSHANAHSLQENEFGILLPRCIDQDTDNIIVLAAEDVSTRRRWCEALHNCYLLYLERQPTIVHNDTTKTEVETEGDRVMIAANFTIEEFIASISRRGAGKEQPLAEICFSHLTYELSSRKNDSRADMKLRALTLYDLSTKRKPIIDTVQNSENDNLIEIGIMRVFERESKHWDQRADMIADAKFGVIQLYFDPLFLSLFVRLSKDVMSIYDTAITRTLFLYASPEQTTEVAVSSGEQRDRLVTKITLKALDMFLVDYGSTFARMTMADTDVKYIMGHTQTRIEGQVGNWKADHLDTNTVYKEILGLRDEYSTSLIRFSYVQTYDERSDRPYFNRKFVAVMESIKLVWLQEIIRKFRTFFFSGPLMAALYEKTNVVSPTTETLASMGFLHIDLSFINPIVILPVSQQSRDCIYANLGHIHIKNEIVMKLDQFLNHYSFRMKAMTLRTNSGDFSYIAVDKTDMDYDYTYNITCTSIQVPDGETLITVPDVGITLSHLQYQMIFRIIDGNIYAGTPATEVTQEAEALTFDEREGLSSLVRFSFPLLTLKLLRGDGTGSDTLAQLIMSDLDVIYTSQKDGRRYSYDVKLNSADAHDLRVLSRSEYKNFFETVNTESTQGELIHVFVSNNNVTNDMDVLVRMSNPRYVHDPEIVTEISQYFYDRRPENKRKEVETASSLFKQVSPSDLNVTHDTVLGGDIILTHPRKMFIRENDSGTIVIDGNGHYIDLQGDEPTIDIAPGMTLVLRNVKLYFDEDLESCVTYGDENSTIVAPTTEGVIHASRARPILVDAIEKKLEKPVGSFKVECDLNSGTIVLPVDPSDKDGRVLVVNLGMYFLRYTKPHGYARYKAQLRDLKAHSRLSQHEMTRTPSASNLPETPTKILSEFPQYTPAQISTKVAPIVEMEGISVDLITEEHEENALVLQKSISIVLLGDLVMRVAYQDVKMINEIFEKIRTRDAVRDEQIALMVAQSPDEDSEKEKSQSGSESEDEDSFAGSDDENDDDEQFAVAEESAVPEVITMEHYGVDFDSNKSKISVVLVDDVRGYDVPLMQFIFSEMYLLCGVYTTSRERTEFATEFIVYIASNYYNMNLAEWEPVLENHGLQITYQRTHHDLAKPPVDAIIIRDVVTEHLTSLSLPKSGALYFNISHAMISTIMSSLKAVREETSGKGMSLQFDPYSIRNHCGYDIQVTTDNDQQKDLTFGEEWAFSPSVKYLYSKFSYNEPVAVLVQIPDLGLGATLDARKAGTFLLRKDQSVSVFIDVELVGGRRIITVRSAFKLKNHTTVSWLVGRKEDRDVVQIDVIEPEKSMGISIGMLEAGSLVMRPAHEEYEWSEVFPNRTDGSHVLKCEKHDSRPFFAMLKYTSDYKLGNHIRSCTVTIVPPIAIENLLGCAVTYHVFECKEIAKDPTRTLVCKGQLAIGEKQYFYSPDMSGYVLLRVKPSDPVPEWRSKFLGIIYSAAHDVKLTSKQRVVDKEKNEVDILFDHSDSGDAFHEVSVYCPFWIVNRTRQKLTVKDPGGKLVAGQFGEDVPLMCSFPEGDNVSIKINDSSWTDYFSLVNVGVVGNLSCTDEKYRYGIGMHNILGPGKFKRTRVITFSPRYVIVNKTEKTLVMCQQDSKRAVVINGDRDYHWKEKEIRSPSVFFGLRRDNGRIDWATTKLELESVGEISMKVTNHEDPSDRSVMILTITIKEEMGTLFIVVKPCTEPSYQIINDLDEEVLIAQDQEFVHRWWNIQPNEQEPYVWDDYNANQNLVFKLAKSRMEPIVVADKIVRVGQSKGGDRIVKIKLSQKEGVRILQFTELPSDKYNEWEVVNDEVVSPSDEWDLVEETVEHTTMTFYVDIGVIGISLIENNPPTEIAFIYLEELSLQYRRTVGSESYDLTLQALQVDNQDKLAAYPVVLCGKTTKTPYAHICVRRVLEDGKPTGRYNYVTANVADSVFAIDITFAERLYAFAQDLLEGGSDEDTVEELIGKRVTVETIAQRENHYDVLEFYPFELDVSLRFDKREQQVESNLSLLVKTLGFGLNIDRASISLDALITSHATLTTNDFFDRIKSHYGQNMMREMYKMVGSLEMIGNPIGLLKDVRQGVRDLVSESSRAQSGDQLAVALTKGSSNIASRYIRGTFRSISSMTGTVARGVSLMTFDKDHIKQKDLRINTTKPKGFVEGFMKGGEALLGGFVGGAKGLVERPIKGAEEGGFMGFIRGMGKGLVATTMEPVGGILEGISMVAAGVARDTQVARKRFPRTFRDDGAVIPYDPSPLILQVLINNSIDDELIEYMMADDGSIYIVTNAELMLLDLWDEKILWRLRLNRVNKLGPEAKTGIVTIDAGNERRELHNKDGRTLEAFVKKLKECIMLTH